MIVKVQIALFPIGGPALVYNEDKSILFHMAVEKDLKKAMGKEPKKFFEAEMSPDGSRCDIFVKSEVEDQGW